MNKQKNISIKQILMFVVILLGTVPLILMHTIINKTVRDNIIKNTTVLTRGILEQSQKNINNSFNELNTFNKHLQNDEGLLFLLNYDHLSKNSITYLSNIKKQYKNIKDLAVIDINESFNSVLFTNKNPNGEILDIEEIEIFLKSQTALLLKENNTRSLWIGTHPKGLEDLQDSIWNYQVLKTKSSSYIIATKLREDLILNLIKSIENSTISEVKLITADNNIYPQDNSYFSYSFAPKTLSRSNKGRFISFSDKLNNKNIFVQFYSDPIYFYNLVVYTPERNLLHGYQDVLLIASVALIILSVLSICFGLVSVLFLQKRINKIINTVKSIANGSKNFSLSVSKLRIKEDILLTGAIVNMATEVEDKRNKLELLNNELENRFESSSVELHKTRESLIHSEKMALLSHNAAKIAHEINNPLGVTVTAVSHLSSMIHELQHNFNNNDLRKSYLENFISSAEEISGMIQHNIARASDLSTRFKNFASDQSSNEKRQIYIYSYISEIIKNYSFKLKNSSHSIYLRCERDLLINTYPSIMYQIITNLINNSLLHGFDSQENGVIEIIINRNIKILDIQITDNGMGIPKENMEHIFRPFFTTKKEDGGTGLGLNIIKDLVTNQLKGNIECISETGEGTTFSIQIPIEGD